MAWSGPDEDLLRKLAAEGLSGSQIAVRLNKSRSAVLGKAWRFGLCLGGLPDAGGSAVVRLRRKRNASKRKKPKPFMLFNQMGMVDVNAPKRVKADGFVPKVFPPAPEHQRKTVATLEEASCRWPIGDPQHADFHFCGADKVPGLPYCEAHCAHAFVSPGARRREYHDGPTIELKATLVIAFATEDA
jgi:GcrA cell cycle regulator